MATNPTLPTHVHLMSSYFFSMMQRVIVKKRRVFSFTDQKDDSLQLRYQVYYPVRTWTRGVDIFSKSYVLVPINMDLHWSVALVQFSPRPPPEDEEVVDEDRDKANDACPQVKVFTLDSLGRYHDPKHVAEVIRLYLNHEWMARRVELDKGREWPIPARNAQPISTAQEVSSNEDDVVFVDGPAPSNNTSANSVDSFVVLQRQEAFPKLVATSINVPWQNDSFNCGIFALNNVEHFVNSFHDVLEDKQGEEREEDLERLYKEHSFSNSTGFRKDLARIIDLLTTDNPS